MTTPAHPATDNRPRTAVALQLNGMGDLVWHVPYIRKIAETSRDGLVTVITPPTSMARELVGHEPWLREVVEFDRRPRRSERRRGRHSGLFGPLRFGAELAPKKLERMVLFSDHPGRAIIACWRAGIRTKLGYGATWIQRLMLTKSPWIQMYDGPAVAGYKDATTFALAQGFIDAPIVPRISVRPDSLARMEQRLSVLPRPLHALSIGSSEPFKQWGVANFAALANLLASRGHGVLIIGGPAEAELAQDILRGVEPALLARVMAITDCSVSETVAAMSLASTCAGNDTGATNIAAAVGTRTHVILGPRPDLEHDPENLLMVKAANLSDIRPTDIAAAMLADLA